MKIEARCLNDLEPLLREMQEWDWSKGMVAEVKAKRNTKTVSQNRLLWMWYTELYEKFKDVKGVKKPKTVHKLMCKMFLGYCEEKIGNTIVRSLRTTTEPDKLDTGEMYEFMQKIYLWALDKDIFLTIPEDSEYAKYKEAQR